MKLMPAGKKCRRPRSSIWPHGIESGMKVCHDCGIEKPFDAFHLTTRVKDGRGARCKVCHLAMLKVKRIPPQPRACWGCGKTFTPSSANRHYCRVKCRPSTRNVPGHRQSRLFKIEGMTAAEFSFKTIMEKKGITVKFLGSPGGRGIFQLNDCHYTPDFKNPITGEYYEVCGSRQALAQNRKKYLAMRSRYPGVSLHIVLPDGQLMPKFQEASRVSK